MKIFFEVLLRYLLIHQSWDIYWTTNLGILQFWNISFSPWWKLPRCCPGPQLSSDRSASSWDSWGESTSNVSERFGDAFTLLYTASSWGKVTHSRDIETRLGFPASLDPSINDFTLQVWTAGGGKSFARLRDLETSITKPIHHCWTLVIGLDK